VFLCLKGERNFKIHTAAAFYVVVAGLYARLAPWQWAAVFLCIAAVFAGELINSALERLADAVRPEWDRRVGQAKDMAAGGVLVLALGSVAVGIAVFFTEGTFGRLITGLKAFPYGAVAAAALPPIVYFVFGRKGYDKENRHDYHRRPAERGQVDPGERPGGREDLHRDA